MISCMACGSSIPQGKSQCPTCLQWNDPEPSISKHGFTGSITLADAVASDVDRILTGPWDEALGGGIVIDSVILIGGEPGAGKSTLALHVCSAIAEKRKVLYIATEESPGQIKGRADRLGVLGQRNIQVLFPDNVGEVEMEIKERKPQAIILDSLPGLVGYDEKRAIVICEMLKRYAIEFQAPSIIIDHINKEGDLAGLMRLQHAVDVVLTFRPHPEGRVIRAEKNRHGAAFIECWLSMGEKGLIAMQGSNHHD